MGRAELRSRRKRPASSEPAVMPAMVVASVMAVPQRRDAERERSAELPENFPGKGSYTTDGHHRVKGDSRRHAGRDAIAHTGLQEPTWTAGRLPAQAPEAGADFFDEHFGLFKSREVAPLVEFVPVQETVKVLFGPTP